MLARPGCLGSSDAARLVCIRGGTQGRLVSGYTFFASAIEFLSTVVATQCANGYVARYRQRRGRGSTEALRYHYNFQVGGNWLGAALFLHGDGS